MVIASEIHGGMVIRIEGQIYKVLEVESKAGAAKMGHARWNPHPQALHS
jgi:translation elongation factor P/translation initiation factor 5A